MARLRISLLGPFQVLLDGAPVSGFRAVSERALLAYLAAESECPHQREMLAEMLWPERSMGTALANLRHALSGLRKAIGDHTAEPPFLHINRETLQFNARSEAVVDLCRFDALVTKVFPPLDNIREAVGLWRGSVLEGFSLGGSPAFEEWLALIREQANRRMAEALTQLVDRCIAEGEYGAAIDWVRQRLALEPWNEEAHQQLMRLLAVDNQRDAAIHQYEICRRTLAQTLNVLPQPETVALADCIRSGKIDPSTIQGHMGRRPLEPASLSLDSLANMPRHHTPFFGRIDELAQIDVLLGDPACRLLTIVGAGGVGKTRLAVEVAARQAKRFAHGVIFVPLVDVNRSEQIAVSILEAMQLSLQGVGDPLSQLRNLVSNRQMLLILDNFEQLAASADLLVTLLDDAPHLKLIITSRVRLNLSMEWLAPVHGLAIPLAADSSITDGRFASENLLDLTAFSAIQLFLHCMRRLLPGFELNPADDQHAIRICQLLDGIPLAIELATTWARTLSLPHIIAQLKSGLDLLSTTQVDMPDRHHSMRAVFDHSWQLLPPRERGILRQLSVFQGSFTLDAAQAVTGASLADLASLIDKSWLSTRTDDRYEVHELVRQYCAERLDLDQAVSADETASEVRRRHSAYYGAFVQRQIETMNFHEALLANLTAEFGNLMAAWDWTVSAGEMSLAAEMALTYFFYAENTGYYRFVIRMFEAGVDLFDEYGMLADLDMDRRYAAAIALGWIQFSLGSMYAKLGLLEEGCRWLERNERLLRRLGPGDTRDELLLLTDWHMAFNVYNRGHLTEARQRYEQILEMFEDVARDYTLMGRTVGARFWQAHAQALLAKMAWHCGHYVESRQRLAKALALCDQIGEQRYRAQHLLQLARLLFTTGDYRQAEKLAWESLDVNRSFGDRIGVASSHLELGRALAGQQRYLLAYQHCVQSARVGRQSGDHRLLMESLTELGRIELALRHPARAVRHFEEALVAFERLQAAHSNYVAGVALGFGWAALAMGDLPAAGQRFVETLKTKGCAAWEAMDALAGLAEIHAVDGDTIRAVALFAVVDSSPVTADLTRRHANQVVDRLRLHRTHNPISL